MFGYWLDEFAEMVANEGYKLIKSSSKAKKDGAMSSVVSRVMRYYIERAVLDVLYQPLSRRLSPEAAHDKIKHDFEELRELMQSNIAEAFESAFRKYLNESMDYYCVISTFPEPINKEMI